MPNYTIGLDARLSGVRHAGIGRYVKNLALRLPFFLPPEIKLVYFFADKTQWSEIIAEIGTLNLPSTLKAQTVFSRIKIVIAPIKHYTLAEQLKLPRIFAAEKLDLLHVPHFNCPLFSPPKKILLTIHDLTWHHQKGLQATTLKPWQYYFKYWAYHLLLALITRRAQTIITDSQTAATDLNHLYPATKKKTQVILIGVTDFHRLPATPPKTKLPPHYLLYVGSLYPHKNVTLILQALQRNPRLQLVLVSARDAFATKLQQQVTTLSVTKQVTFLGKVTDAQLKYLYQHAQALVQPSLAEGFGLTGIEAMSLGTPVLASKIPVFQEIYQDAFFAFNPQSLVSFQAAYQKLLTRQPGKTATAGRAQAARYHWDHFAQKVAQLYLKTLHAQN